VEIWWQIVLQYIQTNPIEICGFVLTVLSIWLNTKQNPWAWGVGILSILCYIYVFASVWLVGDFLLNIYFFITSIYGWYLWQFKKKEKKYLPISRLSLAEIKTLIVIGAVATFLLGKLLSSYPQAAVPYWDAETTAFSLIGQWLLVRKKIESWLVWLFVNLQYVAIFFYKDLIATSLLYFILTILAIKGWYEWKKSE
jgi:nicotinamide mononucleotide transporter